MEQKIWDIIAKDVSGEATAEETKYLQELAETDAETAEMLKDAEENWNAAGAANPFEFNADKGWDKFLENTGQAAKVRSIHIEKGQTSNNKFIFKIAAAIVVLFATSLVAYNLFFNTSTIVAVTAANEKIEVILPDGTVVNLNEESTLEYPKSFNGGERLVTLKGEAFFEVTKDPENPFIIKTDNSLTTVLGTSFNIKSNSSTSLTEIVVFTGKVSFKSIESNKEVLLTAGNSAVLYPDNELVKLDDASTNSLSWKTNNLEFNEALIKDVIIDLENHFKINIKTSDKTIANCRFTGTFDDPTLEEVLQSLSFTHNINFAEQENQIILSGTGCQ